MDNNRERQSPHIEGQFSTSIYIPLNSECLEIVNKYFGNFSSIFSSAIPGTVERIPVSDLHLSLSRNVFLKPYMIHPFMDELRGVLKGHCEGTIFLSNDVRAYWNDQGNTVFGALPVDIMISPAVGRLITLVDGVMSKYGLEIFYQPPDPHVSLVYSVREGGDDKPTKPATVGSVEMPDDHLDRLRIDYSKIHVRIGKEIYEID